MAILFILASSVFPACKTTPKPVGNCHVYAVAPPKHIDEAVSDTIASGWIRKNLKKLEKCHRIVLYSKSKETFNLLNVDFNSTLDFDDFSVEQGVELNQKFGATHIVKLFPKKVKPGYLVTTKTVRINDMRPIHKNNPPSKTMVKVNQRLLRESRRNRKWIKLVSLIPNAVTGGYTQSFISNEREYSQKLYEELGVQKNNILPRLISSVSLTNVSNRMGYDSFDFSTRPYFSLNVFAFDNTYEYQPLLPEALFYPDPFEYSISLYQITPVVNYELAFHSPIGTTFAAGGVGFGFFRVVDSLTQPKYGVSFALRVSLGHRAFFSERIYGEFYTDAVASSPAILENEVFYNVQNSAFGFILGYFLPETRTYARDLL